LGGLYIAKKYILKNKSVLKSSFFFFSKDLFSTDRIFGQNLAKIARFLFMVQVDSQKCRSCVLRNLLSYLACSKIWLDVLVGHRHFGYVINLTQKKTFAGW
jgi:hypothetical protein